VALEASLRPARTIAHDPAHGGLGQSNCRPRVIEGRRPAMGGTAAIVLVGGTRNLLDDCFALLGGLETAWSRFIEGSELWQLNWSRGSAVRVSAPTVRLVTELISAWSLTDGDFDPTTLPCLVAEGYGSSWVEEDRRTALPETAAWPGDMSCIDIDGLEVRLPLGTTLDAGGLGKGLAADIVTAFALNRGARGALAEVGGDLVVAGEAPDGVAWTVGIEDPFAPGTDLTVVRLIAGAVATSSRLKRRWNTPSGSAHHLIDSATGRSAVTTTVASTVIAGSGARAEALSKLAFVREPGRLLAWLPRVDAYGLVVASDHGRRQSPQWTDFE
jgi:FAD:protein FMN transferase